MLLTFNSFFYFGISQNVINETKKVATKKINCIYIYYDGNGNKYTLLRNILEYIPIKAAESSSGIYDGGIAFKKTLNDIEHKKLLDLFKKLLTHKSGLTTINIKPNCSIKLEEEVGSKTILIKATNKTNIEVLTFLKSINK